MSAKKAQNKNEPYQQILYRLANIEHKVDSIDETNAFALRGYSEVHKASVKEIFKGSKRKAQVYLAADGSRGVEEIAKHLGMKQPNVSPMLKHLKSEGLLEILDAPGRQDFYTKKAIDRTLRITKFLCEEYNLAEDGRPRKKKKKKKH